MSDLIDRLRMYDGTVTSNRLCEEAADRIAELEARLDAMMPLFEEARDALEQIMERAKLYADTRAKGNFLVAEEFNECWQAGYMAAVTDYYTAWIDEIRSTVTVSGTQK